jgi:succinyl-diaminopimelate desuccinylase
VRYTEQLQSVGVGGGVAPNVVPDVATLTLNHRVAPDRTKEEAASWLRDYLGALIEENDHFIVEDWASGAPPSLTNERLSELVRLTGKPAAGKVGWTDVATFQGLGIPSTNFGAGDPLLAHRSDEFVTLGQLDEFAKVLSAWLA